MGYIFFIILIFFALFGFCEFLHIVKLKIIYSKPKIHSCLLMQLENGIAEKQLLFACEQYRWYGNKFADLIVPICDKLDDETYARCKKIAEKYEVEI